MTEYGIALAIWGERDNMCAGSGHVLALVTVGPHIIREVLMAGVQAAMQHIAAVDSQSCASLHVMRTYQNSISRFFGRNEHR